MPWITPEAPVMPTTSRLRIESLPAIACSPRGVAAASARRRPARRGGLPAGAKCILSHAESDAGTVRRAAMTRMRGAAVLAAWLGVVLASGGCAYFARQNAQDTENLLAAAGFTMKPADTADKLAHLKQMPVRTIVSRSKGDQLVFTYADPEYCKCMWVGN